MSHNFPKMISVIHSFYLAAVLVNTEGDESILPQKNVTEIGRDLTSEQALDLAKNVFEVVMSVGCENLQKFGMETSAKVNLVIIELIFTARIPRKWEQKVDAIASKFFSELAKLVCLQIFVKEPNKNPTVNNFTFYSQNFTVINYNAN